MPATARRLLSSWRYELPFMHIPGDPDLRRIVPDWPTNIASRQDHLRAVVERAEPKLIGHVAIKRNQCLILLPPVERCRPGAVQSVNLGVDQAAAIVSHPTQLSFWRLVRREREVL